MELFRALGALAEPPSPETERLAAALGIEGAPTAGDYETLFLFQLYPYASVYLGAEGLMGGEARDRIAGFWRALGLEPPTEPDHLALMLGLYARLADLEATTDHERPRAAWRHARRVWLTEHLTTWLPVYLLKMRDIADPFYARWAAILEQALADEVSELGPARTAPLHEREAPGLQDPRRAGGDALLSQLLSPIRTGLVLTATDFRLAARDLGLGLRAGERRFVLRALVGQDAAATLRWLAGYAADAERRYATTNPALLPALEFWRSRARATSELLRGLAREADESHRD